MGKGGTKFEGEAIGSRGKRFKSYTLKDRKKDLEDFQKTGVHPEIEAIRQKRTEEALAALPDPETGRPRTYLEFAINKDVVGKVVFEVFQDFTPLPARAFINRCQQGSTSTVQGTGVHKVLPGMGIYLGRNPRYKGEVTTLRNLSGLRHVDAHTMSVSPDGTELVISLLRSLTLDASYMVVGRVQQGQEVLQQILDLGTDAHDAPNARVTITACGMANAKGVVEEDTVEAAAAQRRQETPEETVARLAKESHAAQDNIREALQAGLKRKEPATEAAAAAPPVAKLARGHFDVLGSGSSDSSSSDDS